MRYLDDSGNTGIPSEVDMRGIPPMVAGAGNVTYNAIRDLAFSPYYASRDYAEAVKSKDPERTAMAGVDLALNVFDPSHFVASAAYKSFPLLAGMFGGDKALSRSLAKLYHGTINAIDGLVRAPTVAERPYAMPDQLAGAHWAQEPEVSNRFSGGLYHHSYSNTPGEKAGKVFYGVPENPNYLTLDQASNLDRAAHSDQALIGAKLASLGMAKSPDEFVRWAEKRMAIDQDKARDIWEKISRGEAVKISEHSSPVNNFYDLFLNWDAGLLSSAAEDRDAVVKKAVNALKDEGWAGIRYKNTSGNEVGRGEDPTAYINFDPENINPTHSTGIPQGSFSFLPDSSRTFEFSDPEASMVYMRDPATSQSIYRPVEIPVMSYVQPGDRVKLSEIYEYPTTYHYYPELKDYDVEIVSDGRGMRVNQDSKTLYLDIKEGYDKLTPDKVAHEVQHIIDKLEGRISGSSPVAAESWWAQHGYESFSDLRDRRTDLREEIDDFYKKAGAKIDEAEASGADLDTLGELAMKLTKQATPMEKQSRAYDKLSRAIETEDYYELYRGDFGEQKARAAARRLRMTPNALAADPPLGKSFYSLMWDEDNPVVY